MKLRNKKTGMIGEVGYLATSDGKIMVNNINDQDEWYEYNSLAELNEEWEDYREPAQHWYIYGSEPLEVDEHNWNKGFIDELKSIGNYFETKEEAQQAVEKLKAWKRLKDKGFRFKTYMRNPQGTYDVFAIWKDQIPPSSIDISLDLNLLFGGE